MRTLCDVCEAAPAQLFCAADEAALCLKCDEEVHGCNKLASRHVRLELQEARAVPRCDICENAPAFFFCGIDGTSLCFQCDMDVHIGGKKTHERYLLMAQRVELPSKKQTPEEAPEAERQPGELNSGSKVKNGGPQNDKHHHHYHHHHHHHHHHEDDPVTGTAGKSNSDWNKSNAPASAIAGGDGESLLLEDSLPQSRMIDLNSQPRHPIRQGSLPSKSDEPTESSDDDGFCVVPKLTRRHT